MPDPTPIAAAHAAWLLAWSLVAFIVYAVDKRAARAGHDARGSSKRRRVPERRLHTLALIGGFPGAWLARRTLRHKTRKREFGWILAVAALIHAGLLGAGLAVGVGWI